MEAAEGADGPTCGFFAILVDGPTSVVMAGVVAAIHEAALQTVVRRMPWLGSFAVAGRDATQANAQRPQGRADRTWSRLSRT